MVGSSIAGTVFVPIDPRTKGKKLAYMLSHAQCRGAFIADYALDNLQEVIDECENLEQIRDQRTVPITAVDLDGMDLDVVVADWLSNNTSRWKAWQN